MSTIKKNISIIKHRLVPVYLGAEKYYRILDSVVIKLLSINSRYKPLAPATSSELQEVLTIDKQNFRSYNESMEPPAMLRAYNKIKHTVKKLIFKSIRKIVRLVT